MIDIILMCVLGIRIIRERNPNRHEVTSWYISSWMNFILRFDLHISIQNTRILY